MSRLLSFASQTVLPRFQFRLRSLVIGITIVAVALAPVRAEIARCSAIEELVKHISQCEGEIAFDYQLVEEGVILHQLESSQPTWVRQALGAYAFAQVVEIQLDGKHISASTFDLIGTRCSKLLHLSLRGSGANNGSLESLAKCRNLRYLELSETAVNDVGVAQLAEHAELETLCLENSQVNGGCFTKLSRLKNLRNLTLCNSPVDDNAIAQLAESKSLEMLFLAGTKVTDAAIPHLARMKSLTTISLGRTGVTEKGREQLKKLRPGLSIS